MFFFKNFPRITYTLSDGSQSREVVDITTAFNIRSVIDDPDTNVIFIPYTIKDHDSPESIANDFYKDPRLFWVILIINNIVNPYVEWPMTVYELELFTRKKYGSLTHVHHFRNIQTGKIYDEVDDAFLRYKQRSSELVLQRSIRLDNYMYHYFLDGKTGVDYIYKHNVTLGTYLNTELLGANIKPVSVFEYEIELNEARRHIKIIPREYLLSFTEGFKNALK